MTTVGEQSRRSERLGDYVGPVVDADIHVQIGTVEELFPFLERGWISLIQSTGFRLPPSLQIHFPAGAPTTTSPEWAGEAGGLAAADYETVRRQLLDPFDVSHAIVTPYWGLDSLRHPELAARLARAINDWLVARFLEKDSRLRGSLTVVQHDPAEAAREIERVGRNDGFVQVHLAIWSQSLWGKRTWLPMFSAMAKEGLVATFHYGGVSEGVPTPVGWPAYYIEHYAAAPQMYLSQLASIVGEGLLQSVPDLRITLADSGFTWLPGILWRLDKIWKGLRRDVPWLAEPPSSLLRERMRVCTQPLDAPPSHELTRIAEWLHADEVLMYASDYPRGHDDDIARLLEAVPDSTHHAIMYANALTHYRL